MNQLQVITLRNQRVLTTVQLAESYGTDNKVISNNFNRNKDRYKEGKHYIALTGEEKRVLLNLHQIEDGSKNAQVLYLWTEKGAWLHAKSLNTDEAWEAYEMLVDEYYKVIEQKVKPLSEIEQLKAAMRLSLATSEEIETLKEDVVVVKSDIEHLKDNIYINSPQAKAIRRKVGEKVYEALGGNKTNAFKHLKNKIFAACWREFRNYFDISEYRELPRVKFEDAMRFLFAWQPNTELRLEIEHYNTQLQLKLVK